MKVAWIAEQGNAFALAERCAVRDVSSVASGPGSVVGRRIASARVTAKGWR
ncbi:MAG: hypothetical protein V5B39_10095 [Accumulibacter sp.]|uniref:hypothetical protein n=1 Tax=Accumulibacter sp. TaxID=2053492 RepID=UPI002FC2B1DA